MRPYDHLVRKERSVLIGGRAFSVWPPRLPRKPGAYLVRPLSLRAFVDLWTGVLAVMPGATPETALTRLRMEWEGMLRASPRLLIGEAVPRRDLRAMTKAQALMVLIAFEQVNDLDFLFTQFSQPPKKSGPQPKENRAGIVEGVAAFMRAFPAYDLSAVMDLPASAFFTLLDTLGGAQEDEDGRRWRKLGPEERRDLMAKLTRKLESKRESANG